MTDTPRPSFQDHLEAAQERLTAHQSRPENRRTLPVVAAFFDPDDSRLVIGLAEVPNAGHRKILERLMGGLPYHVTRATGRFDDHPAGNLCLRPVEGGLKITDVDTRREGTLGQVVFDVIGQSGLLTAGHVVEQPIAAVGQPGANPDHRVGQVVANGLLDPPYDVDVAYVALDDEDLGAPYTVWRHQGSLQIERLTPVPTVGQECTVQGAFSGTEAGAVRATGSVARLDPWAPLLHDIALATYASVGGDSGSPVFARTSTGAYEFLGIHNGRLQVDGVGDFAAFTQVSGALRVVAFMPPS